MRVVAIMKKLAADIRTHPRRFILYGLFGILGLLLIGFVVNEKNWRPLKGKATWKVSSNYSKSMVDFAVDGNLKTLWSSYAPMSSGMFFQVDLGSPSVINGLVLHLENEKWGQPLQWIVKTSSDGEHWQPVVPRQDITYRAMLAILFSPVQARYVQIIQTSIQAATYPWLIGELDLLQPIVPWQFERFTLIFWILGCFFAIGSFLLVAFLQETSRRKVILAIILIGIVLLGWGLRIYQINVYELSEREFQHLSRSDFGKYTHTKWLKAYFENTKTGISWLDSLFIRWAYQFFQEPRISLRIVPAIFGAGTIILVFFLPKFLASRGQTSVCQEADETSSSTSFRIGALPGVRADVTSALPGALASALVGVSGFFIVLSRSGDSSVSLLFFILLYLVVAYRFLFCHGSYIWVPVLTLLVCTGFFIDPAMGYVPIGILVFTMGSFIPQTSRLIFKNHPIRLITFVFSVLPLYVYWYITEKWGNREISLSFVFPKQEFWHELTQALRFSGFTGIMLWVSLAIILVGIVQLLSHKNHGEWFLYIQGIIFSFLVMGFASSQNNSPFLWIVLLMIFLLAKGLDTIFAFLLFRLRNSMPKRISLVRTTVFFAVMVYVTGFSINSLFLGSPVFPYASELNEEYRQKKHIGALIEHIISDPDECKIVVTVDQQLPELYSAIYSFNLYFEKFSELKRISEQGRFWTYLFTSENKNTKEITHFLEQYYTKIGTGVRVSLHKLRAEFYGRRQRYSPRDLHHDTGHHIEDPRSSSGVVRFATPDDPPGLLSFWPALRVCTSGRHTARFVLRSEGDTDEVVAILEVVADSYNVLARLKLKGRDFVNPTTYQNFDLPFHIEMTNPAFQMKRLQFLIHFTGKAEVRLDYIELIPE